MPETWRPAGGDDDERKARRIADFLAGMTDRYALGDYETLFGETPDLHWRGPN